MPGLSVLKRLAAAVAWASLAALQFAHASAQPQPAAQENADYASPAMWRVSDADSDFILLGTFHILPENLHWRTAEFEEVLAVAERIYFEVDATSQEAQKTTFDLIATKGFNAPGVTLSTMLEPQDAQKLRRISSSLGLPMSAIDRMRPWQAFLTLSVQFIVQQGFEPGAGVENVLLKEAKALGKELYFFETIEEQLNLFAGLNPRTERDLLVLTIRDWENQINAFDDLYNAWRRADTRVIDEQMNTQMRQEAPVVYDRLIVKRNEAWAGVIEKHVRDGSGIALVAVGAAHLVGQDSVPELLAEKGLNVTRFGETAPAQ